MKLWIKQAVLVVTVVVVLVGVCLLFTIHLQTNNMMKEAAKTCERNLSVIASHMNAATTENEHRNKDELTKRSVISYYFAQYAGILQNIHTKYALWQVDHFTFKTATYQYDKLLTIDRQYSTEHRLIYLDGSYYFIGYQNATVLDLPITIYHALCIDDTIQGIQTLVFITQCVLFLCVTLLSIILPLVIRKSLRPLNRLTQVAEAISGGAYDLRTGYVGNDEVGALAIAFDQMTGTVQQNISDLEDNLHRRNLLLAALTHELKTPMTAIIGYADSCLTMPLSDEQKSESIQRIYTSAKRVEQLSRKMLSFISYADTYEIQYHPISVSRLLNGVKEEMAATLNKHHIGLEATHNFDKMYGDYDLLFSLLINLIDNAAKASPDNSTIFISAKLIENVVLFTVKDCGCGIPEDQIKLIFEPFYRVDKARDRKNGGVGLGLSLCQMIVSAHNGDIQVSSTLGSGTSISIRMPQGGVCDA